MDRVGTTAGIKALCHCRWHRAAAFRSTAAVTARSQMDGNLLAYNRDGVDLCVLMTSSLVAAAAVFVVTPTTARCSFHQRG
jgi:hypothetical protein